MPALPIISGAEAVRGFSNDGWIAVRQRGSHIIMVKDGSHASLSIPNHRELHAAPCAVSSVTRA